MILFRYVDISICQYIDISGILKIDVFFGGGGIDGYEGDYLVVMNLPSGVMPSAEKYIHWHVELL